MTIIKRFVDPDERSFTAVLRYHALHDDAAAATYIAWAFSDFTRGIVYLQDNIPVAYCIWKHYDELRFDLTYRPEFYTLLIQPSTNVSRDEIVSDLYSYCQANGIQYFRVNLDDDDELRDYYRTKGFRNMIHAYSHQMSCAVITTDSYRPVDSDDDKSYDEDESYVDDDPPRRNSI